MKWKIEDWNKIEEKKTSLCAHFANLINTSIFNTSVNKQQMASNNIYKLKITTTKWKLKEKNE